MSISFFLFKPNMNNIENKYVAKVATGKAEGLDYLAQATAESGLSASSAEIKGILARTCEIIEREVTQGRAVQLGGICTVRPSIRGTFDSINDGYNPDRNSIEVAVTAGARLRKGVQKNASVEKIGHSAPLPDLAEFYDVGTKTVNEEISVGDIGQISGRDLSFDATDPEQGLFVVDGVSPSPMPISSVQKATDNQIVFLNQSIAPTATSVYFLLRRRNQAEGPIIEAQSSELTVTA